MSLRIPSRTDFEILREEAGWLVVNKPAPLIVHPTGGTDEVTLWDLLRVELGSDEVHLVNRLDRETSGCVLVARTKVLARRLGKKMAGGGIRKEYQAIVHGWPKWQELEVESGLRRKGEFAGSDIWIRQAVHPEGRKSITRFEVERRWEGALGRYSQVRCLPGTGRTHQIRVHLESTGHGIVGDKIYGRDDSAYLSFLRDGWTDQLSAELILPRQALHASGMSFELGGEEIEVRSPLSADLGSFCVAPE
ncbi:MAG: RNA pseudouridine synthase [Akkermansiaceae bacterium]